MKKERPILFSPPMIVGILDDQKTMTRRTRGLEILNKNPDDYIWLNEYDQMEIPRKAIPYDDNFYYAFTGAHNNSFLQVLTCPYGKVGDILWVRESFAQVVAQYSSNDSGDSFYLSKRDIFHYIADGPLVVKGKNDWNIEPGTKKEKGFCPYEGDYYWKRYPSIHMPKKACRIRLEITDIKVERVQDISEEDAIAEGIQYYKCDISHRHRYRDYMADASGYGHPDHDYPTVGVAVTSFATLWESINGEESWRQNPWVWAISFKVLSKVGLATFINN